MVGPDEEIIGAAGLIWIGERYYPTPREFNLEAEKMGISRRIRTVPRNFVLGETWVMLAHRKAITGWPYKQSPNGEAEPSYTPGIFKLWLPTEIEVVVDGTETDEVIDGYIERGITPVLVEKEDSIEQAEMVL